MTDEKLRELQETRQRMTPASRDAYARARQAGVEHWVDELIPMADAVIGRDMAIVTATRNSLDVRKWLASKLMPQQYGDQPASVSINNSTNVLVMSDEKLRQLQALRQKMIAQSQGK